MNESELISRYFRDFGPRRADVVLGIGDDAALLTPPLNAELVLTTDALVQGQHFLAGAAAHSLGHRALAVNLSDIAAMGATPSWMLLSLVLPQPEAEWLADFTAGMQPLAEQYQVALVGGNLSRGPLSVTIELAGWVPRGQALRRDGARAGDALFVSGTLGDAAAGREPYAGACAAVAVLQQRCHYPQPRLALGQALRGLASACIDVSDGLYIDAGRLAQASNCAAQIDLDHVPLSVALRQMQPERALQLALNGGEDYELCFSASPQHVAAIELLAARLRQPISRIGTLHAGAGLTLQSSDPNAVKQVSTLPFDHFG